MSERSRLWWEEITGPSQLVRTMAQELRMGRSVFLSAPDDLPWRSQMRSSVECVLRESDPDLLVDYIDCQTDCPYDAKGNIDVSSFLLDRYAYPEIKNGYRRSSGLSIQQYMMKHGVLRNRVVWVKGMSPQHVQNWLSFCKDHRPRAASDGLFVIECHEDSSQRRAAAGMKLLFYKDFVSYYDALLFNNMLAAPLQRFSLEWKQYLSTTAALLCGCDVELAGALLEDIRLNPDPPAPLPALLQIAEEQRGGKRYCADFLDPEHPFLLVRDGNFDKLFELLWKGQLQTIFPLLEYERIGLIRCYEDDIRAGLQEPYLDPKKQEPRYITQLDERVLDPKDAEIGTLYRMNHLRMFQDPSLYLLFLPESGDRERLDLLHRVRNAIAHLVPCPPEEIAAFLDGYPYHWQGCRF